MFTQRPATPEDSPAILSLAQAAGMFGPDDIGFLAGMLDAAFADNPHSHDWQVMTNANRLVGASMFAPELGHGMWNTLFIATDPAHLRQGNARTMMAAREASLREQGARILMVETSGLPQYAPARALYQALGYHQAGRIADYYTPGDDKVIYAKPL